MRALAAGLFALALIAAAAAFMPLGAALRLLDAGRLDLSAARVSGSIWSGTLHDAHFGPLALGDLDVGVEPQALARGAVRLRVQAARGAFVGRATFSPHAGGLSIEDIDGELSPSRLGAPNSLPSALGLRNVRARIEEGRCVRAEGRAVVPAPAGPSLLPALEGPVRCEDGALLLPLAGRGPLGEATVRVVMRGDGVYRAETGFRTADPQAGAGLRLAGFADTGGVFSRIEQGRLWGGP